MTTLVLTHIRDIQFKGKDALVVGENRLGDIVTFYVTARAAQELANGLQGKDIKTDPRDEFSASPQAYLSKAEVRENTEMKSKVQSFLENIIREEFEKITDETAKPETEALDEVTPPGREKQVKTLKKELPSTYVDPATGERKESSPWAVSWASYNKK